MPKLKTPKRKPTLKASNAKHTNDQANDEELDMDDGVSFPHGFDMHENLLDMKIPPMPEPIMNADGGGQRLIISHIAVENFKSYYGRQTIGPFHQNFTAIIGPNGSGKSNVIDSLLFVFGYRASKIRSKKVNVLIHSSAGRENISSCTVSVHFRKIIVINRNEVETVQGSEFFVSRTAYRDNSSRYTLNGRATQFREIAVVLRECGIDLIHNRFLILQGEVEHISLMKPKAQNENEEGMLEYLEDIIGSSRLKLPINKLLCKLGWLQEQRANQLIRLQHAEKEKLALEESAQNVVAKIRVENAITCAHAKIHAHKRLAMVDELSELESIREQQLEKVTETQKELDDLTANTKGLKNEHKRLQKDLERRQEALAKLSAEIGTKKQAITKMENDRKRFEEQREKLEKNIAKETEKIIDLESVPKNATTKLRDYEADLAEAEAAIRASTIEVDTKLPLVQERTAALRAERQKLDAQLGEHIINEDKCAADLALAQEMLANLQREEFTQRRILGEYRDCLAKMEDDFELKSKNLEITRLNLPTLARDLAELEANELRLAAEERQLDERVRMLRVNVEQNRQAAAQFESSNSLLKALMDQKSSGRIRGIYGRLGDLGAIDAKYDVAISTTCAALDNIVVDCVETAQLCIKFLQRERLGIASFIALDKQQHYWQRIRQRPTTPENASRLIDLIRVEDETVLPAFYYALTDTLVASDIQSATRIALGAGQHWRTVTLKGEVVEVSGAMTGGGNAQKRGRIGQEVRVKTTAAKENIQNEMDVKALSEALKKAEENLNEVRYKLNRVRVNLRERQSDQMRGTQLVKNLEADVVMLQKNVDSLRQQIETQEKKLESAFVNPEVLQRHSNEVDRLKKENDEYTKKSDGLRLRLIDMADKINAAEEDIVGPFQRALREAEERKRLTEKNIAKEKNAITSNARNLKNANGRKADLESDLEQVKMSLKKLDDNSQDFAADLVKLEVTLTERRALVTEAETAYTTAMERARELNTGEMETARRLAELREELKCTDERMSHLRSKIAAFDALISKLKLYNLRKLEGLPTDVLEYGKDDSLLADSLMITDREIGDGIKIESVEENYEIEEVEDEEMECDNADKGLVEENSEKTNELLRRRLLGGASIRMARVPRFDDAVAREFDEVALKRQLDALEERKKTESRRDGAANLGLLMDYIQRATSFESESRDYQRITRERDAHREFCERLKKQRLQEFMEGFQKINERLKELYQMITLGGDASLDLVDSLDPFSEGVSFGVRPPKKSWKQITNLSGGEKTLASLALVFGLHHYRPTPLYVMDEIDAALDFRNVSIISSYILERTKNTQFIVISLRNNMFERGNRIVGIYKIHDCTYNAVIDPQATQQKLNENIKAIKHAKKKWPLLVKEETE